MPGPVDSDQALAMYKALNHGREPAAAVQPSVPAPPASAGPGAGVSLLKAVLGKLGKGQPQPEQPAISPYAAFANRVNDPKRSGY